MNTHTSLRESILQALLGERLPGFARERLQDDSIALGAGGLEVSSMAMLQAFVSLEEMIGFTFDDGPVANAKLSTLGDLIRFIESQVASHRAKAA